MTKTIAYVALHYGQPYLASAIRSVIDAVDELWVLYSPVGSHGYRTDALCPDSRDQLLSIAVQVAGDKLRWREGVWHGEGYQRDSIFRFAPDADVVVVLDSDEIWMPAQLERLIRMAHAGQSRNYLAYEMAFWRSFYRAMPDKLCAPVRAINTRRPLGTEVSDTFFGHMGYAQPTPYITFKMQLHGHRSDWRPEWYAERWQPNAQVDVHPTNHDFWYARRVDPLDYLPTWMAQHEFYGYAVIP